MKPAPHPTAAEVRAALALAQQAHLAAAEAYGESLVVQAAIPSRDVSFERDAVQAALQRVEALKMLLPRIEAFEADELAQVRYKLDQDRHRRLERKLADVTKQAMAFAAHASNMVSSWRKLVAAADEATNLLSDKQKQLANGGLAARLNAISLRAAAETELHRIGCAAPGSEDLPAPGTNPANVELRFRSAPHMLPALEGTMKTLSSALLALGPTPLLTTPNEAA